MRYLKTVVICTLIYAAVFGVAFFVGCCFGVQFPDALIVSVMGCTITELALTSIIKRGESKHIKNNDNERGE